MHCGTDGSGGAGPTGMTAPGCPPNPNGKGASPAHRVSRSFVFFVKIDKAYAQAMFSQATGPGGERIPATLQPRTTVVHGRAEPWPRPERSYR